MKIFIPIKENSQRVHRKNFRKLGGEPLYKYSLLKYEGFEVYVDTDSDEIYDNIKNDKRLSNVLVYKRDKLLVGNKVSVCDLIIDFIKRFHIKDTIIQTHITSPFITGDILHKAKNYIGEYDSVVSCTIHHTRLWKKEDYGYCPVNHNPMKLEQTQDLPTMYEENSAFYIFEPEDIIRTGSRIGKNPYFFNLKYPHNLDIDTEEDWKIVSAVEKSIKDT